jgi:hypothetical protein
MKNDMKLIMESWRGSLQEQSPSQTPVKASDYVDKIKLGLGYLSAKAAGEEFATQFLEEVGPELAATAVDLVKTLPVVGNVVSGLSALWSGGKATAKIVLGGGKIAKAAFDVMKIAAEDYVDMDDDKVSDGNPLAVLFNVDDEMEVPLKPEFLSNFAGNLLRTLQQNPDYQISDPDKFAEQLLARYLNNRGHLKDAKPPNE